MYMAYPPQQMPNQQFMRPGMTDDRNQVFYMQQPGMMPGHPMQGYTPGGHMMAMAAGRPIQIGGMRGGGYDATTCLLYTSPSPRDRQKTRMPSSA